MTPLIAASLTWYICTGLIPWEYLGQATTPLYDAARLTGNVELEVIPCRPHALLALRPFFQSSSPGKGQSPVPDDHGWVRICGGRFSVDDGDSPNSTL